MAKWTKPGDVFNVSGMEEAVDHVEHEQRLHSVIGKAFPGFGERDVGEPARMSDETAILRVMHGRRVLTHTRFGKNESRFWRKNSMAFEDSQSATGSNPANISSASPRFLRGTNSHAAENLSHIAQTFGFLCAASIASRDFHSETSMMVPSRARMMIGSRSVTSPSLRRIGTRLPMRSNSSVSFPGLGRYATITITLFIRSA